MKKKTNKPLLMIDPGRSDSSCTMHVLTDHKTGTVFWQFDPSICQLHYPAADQKLSPILKGQLEAAHMRAERSFAQSQSL